LSIGLLFSREAAQGEQHGSWASRLTSLDGKGVLIGFGVVLMILGLIFSASRMGISSLLLAFTLILISLRAPGKREGFHENHS